MVKTLNKVKGIQFKNITEDGLKESLINSFSKNINKKIIPGEVIYLQKYDAMKAWLDDKYQMPDKLVALLIRFLEQNQGSLSKRAKEKEFSNFSEVEINEIENEFKNYFEI